MNDRKIQPMKDPDGRLLAVLVTPRPGTDRRELRRILGDLHAAAKNARGGSTPADRYSNYLVWVANAVGQLRGLVSAADLDRLVLTRRYWLLQSKADGLTALLGNPVDTELNERVDAFGEAAMALNGQIGRWSQHAVFLVADSSFYLQHPDKLEEADLAAILEVRGEPLHLLFPMVVVDELDNLKQSSKSPVRWRAGYTLAVLDRVLRHNAGPARLRAEDSSALTSGGIPRGEVTVEIVPDARGA